MLDFFFRITFYTSCQCLNTVVRISRYVHCSTHELHTHTTHVLTHASTNTHVCTSTSLYVHMHAHIRRACARTHTHKPTHPPSTHPHTHRYTTTYAHIHMHTFTYTHTNIRTLNVHLGIVGSAQTRENRAKYGSTSVRDGGTESTVSYCSCVVCAKDSLHKMMRLYIFKGAKLLESGQLWRHFPQMPGKI